MSSTVLELLPADEILEKASFMSYDELAVEFGDSRGSIWRLLRQHIALKYKGDCLDDFKGVVTGLWAYLRPIGNYRDKYPLVGLDHLVRILLFLVRQLTDTCFTYIST